MEHVLIGFSPRLSDLGGTYGSDYGWVPYYGWIDDSNLDSRSTANDCEDLFNIAAASSVQISRDGTVLVPRRTTLKTVRTSTGGDDWCYPEEGFLPPEDGPGGDWNIQFRHADYFGNGEGFVGGFDICYEYDLGAPVKQY